MNPEYLAKARKAVVGAVLLRPDHRALALACSLAAICALSGGLVTAALAIATGGLAVHVGYCRGTPLRKPAAYAIGKPPAAPNRSS
jgi:hypothetical protein